MKKTATFAVVHVCVAFGITCLITGSRVLGGMIALRYPAASTVACFFHEKAWKAAQRRRSSLTA